jgi:hypothetical protein
VRGARGVRVGRAAATACSGGRQPAVNGPRELVSRAAATESWERVAVDQPLEFRPTMPARPSPLRGCRAEPAAHVGLMPDATFPRHFVADHGRPCLAPFSRRTCSPCYRAIAFHPLDRAPIGPGMMDRRYARTRRISSPVRCSRPFGRLRHMKFRQRGDGLRQPGQPLRLAAGWIGRDRHQLHMHRVGRAAALACSGGRQPAVNGPRELVSRAAATESRQRGAAINRGSRPVHGSSPRSGRRPAIYGGIDAMLSA